MDVRGQKILIKFKLDQALDARDALTKGIYSNLFDWIVATINAAIYRPALTKSFIGVLDIFGFENFKVSFVMPHCDFDVLCSR